MPTNTYSLISSGVVTGSSVATIQFTTIPQTYKHLHIRIFGHSTRNVGNEPGIQVRFNDTSWSGTDYWSNAAYTAGTTLQAAGSANLSYFDYYGLNQDSQNSLQYSTNEFWVVDYTGSTNKSSIQSGANTTKVNSTGIISMGAGYTGTSFTSAVTAIYMRCANGNFNWSVDTRYYLYGVG